MNFQIKNSLMLNKYFDIKELDSFTLFELQAFFQREGFKHVFVDLSPMNIRKYEVSPCGRILMIGEDHIKNIIQIISNALKVN